MLCRHCRVLCNTYGHFLLVFLSSSLTQLADDDDGKAEDEDCVPGLTGLGMDDNDWTEECRERACERLQGKISPTQTMFRTR